MTKLIRCICGYVSRGGTDDEVVAAAQRHIESEHPDLVGKVAREELLAMVEAE